MWVSQVVLVVKNPPANAGDIRDVGSVPGWGTSPGVREELTNCKGLIFFSTRKILNEYEISSR